MSDINLTVSGSESPPRPEDGATTEEWTAYALSGKKDLQGANLRDAHLGLNFENLYRRFIS